MKRIVLLTSGTRGDVQPFVALGQRLQREGMAVRLCTHERFKGFVEQYGIPYAFMNDELLRLADTQDGRALTEGKGNLLKAMRAMGPVFARTLREAQKAAEGCEVIVYHPKALAGASLAEAMSVPGVMVLPVPAMTPTTRFALPLLGDRDWGGLLNRLSYAPLRMSTAAFRGELNRWRKELGLPPEAALASPHRDALGRFVPTLYPVSPKVVPPPADWPEQVCLTGYWFLEGRDPWTPPAELLDFLEAGPPPIAISFSSMVGINVQQRTRTVLEGVARLGVRTVIVSAQGGIRLDEQRKELMKNVMILNSVPFEWLFARAAAVVHHGGAGTTAESLRAGTPTLICPFFGDQPYWGSRIHSLGVGPKPVPQKRLTVAALTEALDVMLNDPNMRKRASQLGRVIRSEDGAGKAVAFLHNLISSTR